ncbi:MAG: Ppx/GppA family phosphatase [Marinibacterium sp.]|nr:Ppx/GppA family phosphatase [Marinibacterium sp.]
MSQTPHDLSQDRSLFSQPLFDDPRARALSRVGVVDVGSNSVRLVIFDGAARSPAYFFNEKIMCGLGAGLAETGRLNPEGRSRALAALTRFQAIASSMDMAPLTAVATAAVRDAEDGAEFCAEVLARTGLNIHIIDGAEEARLSAQGVLLGWPGAYGLVCDIGGSSMELAEISDGTVGRRVTSPLGPLKLDALGLSRSARASHIRDVVRDLHAQMGAQRDRLFLVGGSWRAIARIDMLRRKYPLQVLHEYQMTVEDVDATLDFIAQNDLDTLRSKTGVSSTRMSLVPLATEVLSRVIKVFDPADIALSSYGIREGMLYEQMPQELRDRDPLIEACHFTERKDARVPGFGRVLYDFVMPLFADVPQSTRRLIKAACLLHDVTWRAHPDYRAEVCFETATRANLGGLKHQERVFLGLALLHRYKNKRDTSRFGQLFALLDDSQLRQAEVLGKAMRFGAMLWMKHDARPARLDWDAKARRLSLILSDEAAPLFGEVAASRFNALCNALNATSDVRLEGD